MASVSLMSKHKKIASAPRTYDADGFKRRAACICFRDRREQEILLITSSQDVEKWIVPGGGIDPGEEPWEAAEREALEEAGVTGVVDRLLGVFENQERNSRTWVYAFYVTSLEDHWSESVSLDRRRRWFPLGDAKLALSNHKPPLLNYIQVIEGIQVTEGIKVTS
ncbi:unnamed protein product [Candidula unifasciata]|uniref:diphosphoinositol-polyphosphate diphosphatase n=1 Tax=Candidula unifasciata TaxID=100452 RepID=A0A8S4A411_9EUPU|nr:unnamed protein product [Candidula unifasciata]